MKPTKATTEQEKAVMATVAKSVPEIEQAIASKYKDVYDALTAVAALDPEHLQAAVMLGQLVSAGIGIMVSEEAMNKVLAMARELRVCCAALSLTVAGLSELEVQVAELVRFDCRLGAHAHVDLKRKTTKLSGKIHRRLAEASLATGPDTGPDAGTDEHGYLSR